MCEGGREKSEGCVREGGGKSEGCARSENNPKLEAERVWGQKHY